MNHYNHQLITIDNTIKEEVVVRFTNNLRNNLRLQKFNYISDFFHTILRKYNFGDISKIAEDCCDEIIVLLTLEQIPKYYKEISVICDKISKNYRIIIILNTKYIQLESNNIA